MEEAALTWGKQVRKQSFVGSLPWFIHSRCRKEEESHLNYFLFVFYCLQLSINEDKITVMSRVFFLRCSFIEANRLHNVHCLSERTSGVKWL